MDFNDFASKDSEVRNTGEKTHTILEYLNHHKLMIGKTDSKSTSGQGSEGNEKHSIRNWKKEKSCHIVAEGLAELYPAVI